MGNGYRFSRWEMETTVNFNAKDAMAVLYSRDKSVIRRMDKMVAEFPDLFECIKETDMDKTYRFPKKYAMPKRPRILSEEQREKMRERLMKARENQRDEDDFDDDLDEEFEDEDLDEDCDEDFEDET